MKAENKNISIQPRMLGGDIDAISSKSDVHRILICAALSQTPTRVQFTTLSNDILTTIRCLKAMGAQIEESEGVWHVVPITQKPAGPVQLNCAESGSTVRFLIPVAAALGLHASFTGEGRLPQRPLGPLVSEMERHGIRFSQHSLPIDMTGDLQPGQYSIPGNISSQYITGLLMALPLLPADSSIKLTTHLESRPYVNLTIATLKKFGIQIQTHKDGFFIPGNQAYRSPGAIRAEGDWSNAAFWLCAGAIGQRISCHHLDLESVQGDRRVVDILREFGANVEVEGDTVSVSGGNLHGVTIDASEIPDLITAIVIVAAVAKGKTTIRNAGRLRIKESDRLSALSGYLQAIGADVQEEPEGLLIDGKGKLKGGAIDGQGDHRIVMSAAVASIACEQAIILLGADAVNKSYPEFFEDFQTLGGDVHVIHDR